jgi:hypothetical protein
LKNADASAPGGWRMFPIKAWDFAPTVGWDFAPIGTRKTNFSQIPGIGTLLD